MEGIVLTGATGFIGNYLAEELLPVQTYDCCINLAWGGVADDEMSFKGFVRLYDALDVRGGK